MNSFPIRKASRRGSAPGPRRTRCRPRVETLEDRTLLATAVGALFPEIQANAGINHMSAENKPDVGVAADGSFDAVFEQAAPSGGVTSLFVRRYDATGAIKPTNGTILVDSGPSQPGETARIAVHADGSFAVAYVFPMAGHLTLFVNRYAADGTLLGSPINPLPGTMEDQTEPDIAVRDIDGSLIVAWIEATSAGKTVYARGFDASGNPLSPAFLPALPDNTDRSAPSVAVRQGPVPSGEVVLVLSYTQPAGAGANRVYFQRYTDLASGVVGPLTLAPAATTGSQQQDAVAINPAGNFVITWADVNGTMSNVKFRQFDKNGVPQTAEDQAVGNIHVPNVTPGGQSTPDVAMAEDGRFVIDFVEANFTVEGGPTTPRVAFQQFQPSGRPVSGERLYADHLTITNQKNPAIAANGAGTFVIAADDSLTAPLTTTYDPFVRAFQQLAPSLFAVANGTLVEVRRIRDDSLVGTLTLAAGFQGGPGYTDITTAFGDVTGDGYEDLVVSGAGSGPNVLVYDGKTLATNGNFSLVATLAPYSGFDVGTFVAVGDVNNDGYADVITGASRGNPHVKVYNGRDIGTANVGLLASFFAYGINFNVGTTVAAYDLNGDGYADVVTGALPGNPHVRVFDGSAFVNGTFAFDPATNPSANQLANPAFFAFGINFNIGAYVAVGDIYGDGGDLIVGASAGNPEVRVYRNADVRNPGFDPQSPSNPPANSFFANALGQDIGVTVAAAPFEGAGRHDDILVGETNGPTTWRVVSGTTNDGPIPPPALIVNGVTFSGDFPNGLGDVLVGA